MANFASQMIITVLILSVFYIHLSKPRSVSSIDQRISSSLLGSALICWTCSSCPEVHSNTSSSVRAANCSSSNTICVVRPMVRRGCPPRQRLLFLEKHSSSPRSTGSDIQGMRLQLHTELDELVRSRRVRRLLQHRLL